MTILNNDRVKLGAVSGMLGPILFITIFTVEGWLRSGYEPLRMYVSELSLGPRGWIQIINFIIYGVLFLLFAFSVFIKFKKISRTGPILLMIIGISILIAGIFVVDPVTTLANQMTLHGKLHSLVSAVIFSLWPISCFVFSRQFQRYSNWQSLYYWSLLAGIITALGAIFLSISNFFNPWFGLIQRITIITYLSWQFSFATKLFKKN